ncbi:MAG: DUF2723 domain-containing protein [Saprospiraceae bacterium]|nr:DUF2723 domain-containing protein [Saprospiraceae bacterium]
MNSFKTISNITGWLVFAIAAFVYYQTAEPTGSLWDCGEFILGAYKGEVVHPPGAPLFLLVGRMFIWLAEIFSDTKAHPENIAFAVNFMSGFCTALGAMFLAWTTIILGKLALVGRNGEANGGQTIALAGAGLVAGLSMTFASSVWFSAVEGEVYAMSTFFTCLTVWSMMKWYNLPNEPKHDRWLVFTVYAAALSIGVHLLSLLTFPALAMLYYFKKDLQISKTTSTILRGILAIGLVVAAIVVFSGASGILMKGLGGILMLGLAVYLPWKGEDRYIGALGAFIMGFLIIAAIQELVIKGVAEMWSTMELQMVNGFGMPFNYGLIPTAIVLIGLFFFGLRYAANHAKFDLIGLGIFAVLFGFFALGLKTIIVAPVAAAIFYFGLRNADRHLTQVLLFSALMSVVGFSTIGVVLVRANVDPPVNMNKPSDPIRLLSYVNREQYGERPLLYGTDFDSQPVDNDITPRYGQVVRNEGGKEVHSYEITDEKVAYKYNPADKHLFPRMGDDTQNRPEKYRAWVDKPTGEITFGDNMKYMFRYQFGWMYWRYFAWNFIGRQNGEQGYYSWDVKSGNWESGIKFIDEMRLYKANNLPDSVKNDQAKNHYFFIPLIFGLLGLFFHFYKKPEDATAVMAMFLITGLGIIVYSNQPPNEPRERDYVLVGSFFTFCIWIGMGVLAIYQLLHDKISGIGAAGLGTVLALSAPYLMGSQNWDDHSRAGHYGSRDYASNFLNSCQPNAIIFTYGDNDTYPLWYAQEVEGIRRDVRVVNLSLIQVDWYINLLRRKINDSAPIKLTMSADAYRGKKRNAVYYLSNQDQGEMPATKALELTGVDKKSQNDRVDAIFPSSSVYLQVDPAKFGELYGIEPGDSLTVTDKIPLKMPFHKTGNAELSYLTKDELAVFDVIASNINDRPIYFAVTCRPDKMLGLEDYMQLEGLGLRITPIKSQSEQGLYVYGYGRVDTDLLYDNVMTKFKWGNFDTHPTFIDRSYGPSIQSIRVVMLRGARRMLDKGEKDKAIGMMEKYLAAFPHYNFPYDWNTMQMLNVMVAAGGYEKAKPHLKTLATETKQQLTFLTGLNPELTKEDGTFGQDLQLFMNVRDLLKKAVESQKDEEFKKELDDMFAPFK